MNNPKIDELISGIIEARYHENMTGPEFREALEDAIEMVRGIYRADVWEEASVIIHDAHCSAVDAGDISVANALIYASCLFDVKAKEERES